MLSSSFVVAIHALIITNVIVESFSFSKSGSSASGIIAAATNAFLYIFDVVVGRIARSISETHSSVHRDQKSLMSFWSYRLLIWLLGFRTALKSAADDLSGLQDTLFDTVTADLGLKLTCERPIMFSRYIIAYFCSSYFKKSTSESLHYFLHVSSDSLSITFTHTQACTSTETHFASKTLLFSSQATVPRIFFFHAHSFTWLILLLH